MLTTVTIYCANGVSASLSGIINLDAPANSALRLAEVSGLLGHTCELLINEPGYAAYGQENAAEWAALNPIVKTPDGQALHGDILIINRS